MAPSPGAARRAAGAGTREAAVAAMRVPRDARPAVPPAVKELANLAVTVREFAQGGASPHEVGSPAREPEGRASPRGQGAQR